MVQLHDEGDLVGVAAGHDAEAAEGGGDGRGAPFEGELDEVGGVEVGRVLGEGGGGRVLDALVDGEDGEVAGAAEPAVGVDGGQVADDGDGAVARQEDPVDVVGAGEGELVGGDPLALVGEEILGVVSEELLDIGGHGAEPNARGPRYALMALSRPASSMSWWVTKRTMPGAMVPARTPSARSWSRRASGSGWRKMTMLVGTRSGIAARRRASARPPPRPGGGPGRGRRPAGRPWSGAPPGRRRR